MRENGKIIEAAVIVAHPDDETLWAGGTILCNPGWNWFIVCTCRAYDIDRAPRFYNTLKVLHAEGIMGDLDDGPDQKPLDEDDVENTILKLLPQKQYDLVITHNLTGEYTKHLRHEEMSRAVIKLCNSGKISAKEIWTFAYEDGNKQYFPRPIENATIYSKLSPNIWSKKYEIITQTYNFNRNSWEAETTPHAESFWKFTNINDAQKWLNNGGVLV